MALPERELYPILIAPSARESRVSKLREQVAERRRATPSITVGDHAVLGQKQAAHVMVVSAKSGQILGRRVINRREE